MQHNKQMTNDEREAQKRLIVAARRAGKTPNAFVKRAVKLHAKRCLRSGAALPCTSTGGASRRKERLEKAHAEAIQEDIQRCIPPPTPESAK